MKGKLITRRNGGNPNWQKGVSGNPKGRPPNKKLIPDILREIGDQPAPPDIIDKLQERLPSVNFQGINNLQALMYRIYFDAEDGDNHARELIAERTEGKVSQSIDIGGQIDPAAVFKFQIVTSKEEAQTDDQASRKAVAISCE